MRIEANQILLKNEYPQGYGEMVEELTKERLVDEVKRKFWEIMEPYVKVEVKEENMGRVVKVRMDYDMESKMYACKSEDGMMITPKTVITVKPVLEG